MEAAKTQNWAVEPQGEKILVNLNSGLILALQERVMAKVIKQYFE
jgi:hypothetical protein